MSVNTENKRVTPMATAPDTRSVLRRRSLRYTLIGGSVILAVLPVAVALSIAISRTNAQARQQVANQLDSIAEAKEASVAQSLVNTQTILRSVVADQNAYANAVALVSRPGGDDALRTAVTYHLESMMAAQNEFGGYFIYDLGGNVLASTNPVEVGRVTNREPYFADSLLGEHIQSPFYKVGENELQMVASLPLVDNSGQPVGVLAGRLSLEGLSTVMGQRAGLGETGETYLVSLENNYLVTASRFEGYPLARSYHSPGIDNALAGQDGIASYQSYREVPVIGAYRWLPELEVGLVAEIEQAEAFAASRVATRISILVAVLFAVIAAGVGLFLALRITAPITELTRTARILAAGNLDARTNFKLQNEIGELGQTFNAMAGRLQATLIESDENAQEARRASAMAREASRLKSEFLATMSHELRTPLNAIIGFTEIMLEGMGGTLDDDAVHMTSRVQANSSRLLGLIDDVLNMAKIESRRIEVVHKPIVLKTFASELHNEMSSLAEENNLAFDVQVDPRLPHAVKGDRSMLERITLNLLSNAFKFTHEGTVRLVFRGGHDGTWEIAVEDTGIGIPKHAQQYIFEEFRQVDSSTTRAYGGTGLGLAIVRQMSQLLDGNVRVESVVGKGSKFIVTLPMVIAELEPELSL